MKRLTTYFFLCIGLTLAFEQQGLPTDPWANIVYHWSTDLSSMLPFHFILSPLELSLVLIAGIWLFRSRKLKKAFGYLPGTLDVPVLVFFGFITFGVLYGAVRGGDDLTVALWEVRGFLMLIGMYFLTGIFIRSERGVNRLIWTIFIASTVLALENIFRWIFILKFQATSDLSYEHIDSVVLVCALLLSGSVWIFGGTRGQRRYSLFLLPLSLFCILIMERRAAFPVLGIGIIALVVFLLRLRPRIFWTYIPVLTLLIAAYLVIFWNHSGVLGQPARALASQFHPDPRDFASNMYRAVEKADIQLNIFGAPFTGLGFGQKYQMYIPLPNLSFWQFWHYETHNAVLWVWMKDGIFGFIAFWWLMGRGVFDGSRAVESQREEWALARFLRKRFARDLRTHSAVGTRGHSGVFRVALRRNVPAISRGKHKSRSARSLVLNVPAWERSDDKRSVTLQRSGIVALMVVSISLIPAQIVYSYVDLGLTSERDMLLFGVTLGLIARGAAFLGIAEEEKSKRLTIRKKATVKPNPVQDEESRALAQRLLLLPVGSSTLSIKKAPTSRQRTLPVSGDATRPPSGPDTSPDLTLDDVADGDISTHASSDAHVRPQLTRAGTARSRPLQRRISRAVPAAEAHHADEPLLPWEHPPKDAKPNT